MTEHRRTKRSQPPTSTQNVVKTITSPITGLVRIVALVLVSSIGFVFASIVYAVGLAQDGLDWCHEKRRVFFGWWRTSRRRAAEEE